MALGLLLATLLAMALASTRADAALTSGTAFAWGYNYDGQLGNDTNGDGTEINIPGAVRNLSGVKSVKAGCDHSLALKNDGTVRAWGDNDYGQLGNGTDAPRNTPGAVNNLTNVKAMATDSSARHTLALLGVGTVKTWGYNDHGQLGDGTSLPGTYRAKPARIANLTGVRAVATGGFHSLALLTSGRVKSWGNNNQGELGNGNHGDSADRSTPVTVIGLDNVRSARPARTTRWPSWRAAGPARGAPTPTGSSAMVLLDPLPTATSPSGSRISRASRTSTADTSTPWQPRSRSRKGAPLVSGGRGSAGGLQGAEKSAVPEPTRAGAF